MYKIVFVLPSEKIAEMALRTFQDHDRQEAENGLASAGQFVCEIRSNEWAVAIHSADQADALIARGTVATALKGNRFGIPVVELPIMGTELLYAMASARQQYGDRKVAAIGSDNMIAEAERLGSVIGMQARPYAVRAQNLDHIRQLVLQARSDGCEVVISGYHAVEYARSLGLGTVIIESGYQAHWLSISEAKRVIQVRQQEREKTLRMQAILDHVHEGILALDRQGTVTMINGMAGALLGVRPADVIGHSFSDVIPEPVSIQIGRDTRPTASEIVTFGNIQMTVSRIPLIDCGETVGAVIALQDITKIQEAESRIRSKIYLRGHVARFELGDVTGSSEAIRETVRTARRFAAVSSNILIAGETGTGKELFAQGIHRASSRAKGPFVAINCAALPENLLESELFGYVEGAFTGAAKSGKPGLFELAHQGTIFLDEISDLPSKLQGRLLRVLQERSIMRLGHDRVISVDVRVIAATNKDLDKRTASGEFREDLYFRLNVLKLQLPPLRQRAGDIRLLASHFLAEYAHTFGRGSLTLSDAAAALLERAPWPGNVRELRNVCERLAVLTDGDVITPAAIAQAGSEKHRGIPAEPVAPAFAVVEPVAPAFVVVEPVAPARSTTDGWSGQTAEPAGGQPLREQLDELESSRIRAALAQFGNNKVLAARHLGISRTTLWRRRRDLEGLPDDCPD